MINMGEDEKDAIAYALQFVKLTDEEVKSFSMISEKDELFGSSVHDLVSIFGVCVIEHKRVCAINTKDMYFKTKDAILDYLMDHICDREEDGALEIVFLNDANVLNYTGQFVKGINPEILEKIYNNKNIKESDFTSGDVKNRSQAK